LPIAAAISFLNGVSESNAIFARSSPAASDTRLGPLFAAATGATGAAMAIGIFDAAIAAAPPNIVVFRKFLREFWQFIRMRCTSWTSAKVYVVPRRAGHIPPRIM
jgi:hypothetical protein